MASQCKQCREEITWAKSMHYADRWFPLDRYPDPGAGCVRKRFLTENGEQVVYGQVLTGSELHTAVANSEHLYARHRDTCRGSRPRTPRPAHIRLDLKPLTRSQR